MRDGSCIPRDTLRAFAPSRHSALRIRPRLALPLLAGGLIAFVALAFFAAPARDALRDYGELDPARRHSIGSDIATAVAGIDLARGALGSLRRTTTNLGREAELDQALESVDEARAELYDADIDVMNAAHPSAEDLRKTLASAMAAILRAQEDAEWALDDFPAEQANVRTALQDALAASRRAYGSMRRVEREM